MSQKLIVVVMDSKKYSINNTCDNSTVVSEQVGIYGNSAKTLMSSDDNQDWRRLAVSKDHLRKAARECESKIAVPGETVCNYFHKIAYGN